MCDANHLAPQTLRMVFCLPYRMPQLTLQDVPQVMTGQGRPYKQGNLFTRSVIVDN
jgi:hypothetical protein